MPRSPHIQKSTDNPSETKPYTLAWISILSFLTLLGPMSIDMYLPAFPEIAIEFGVTTSVVSSSLPAYFLGLVIGQLVYGPISDRFGRKPPLYFGLTLFVIASVLCIFTTQINQLLMTRVLQALGGCVGMAMVRAAIRDRLTPKQSARALSSMMLMMGLAPILAPILGGWLLVNWGWQSIFIFLACFGVINIVLVHFYFEETLNEHKRKSLHVGDIFINYFHVCRDKSFLTPTLIGSLSYAAFFSYIAAAPAIFIDQFQIKPENFGYYFSINAAGLIIFSQINLRLIGRFSLIRILLLGILIQVMSAVWLFISPRYDLVSLSSTMLGLFGLVAGLGLVSANSNALALSQQGQRAGTASALQGAIQFLICLIVVPISHSFNFNPLMNLSMIIMLCTMLALILTMIYQKQFHTI
ncbi:MULTISPECIES: Bcr/CflA family multidrug efflux MFS transporter [Acinetobacter]|uniref:Bcr/CflA family multidrug efflux MFS transporter n=1 Tax=Acinetobacter TaxID=469 RepID=UPI00141B8575|nr:MULTISPECIES: Bcr/CflA family multidrug efflux MFS transporter [Acinetobacter]MCS4296711.1 DHA1 family bicyclomycin/chloramphenicol resistance-like MFS transporter [Acinetobacter guillouiae]MCW2250833.1 DHA1 family bicyclomycin/chloramphenicol resistance-like MFS transporter [Acinetobacter sp. BIGb0204]NII37069.1 DHA1 family bicyclomycin/chloramphenicol resistance-like MFS transporter [Acinetobacter sp. BIGb0196]